MQDFQLTDIQDIEEATNFVAKEINPLAEAHIFKSVENVNLSTIIAYKQNGVKHHFLDDYDK